VFPGRQAVDSAALGVFDGSLTTIRAHETNAEGEFNPDLPLSVPEPPAAGHGAGLRRGWRAGRACRRAGIDDALEAIREIVGFGEGLVGRLLMVDARAMRFETCATGAIRPTRSTATRRRSWI